MTAAETQRTCSEGSAGASAASGGGGGGSGGPRPEDERSPGLRPEEMECALAQVSVHMLRPSASCVTQSRRSCVSLSSCPFEVYSQLGPGSGCPSPSHLKWRQPVCALGSCGMSWCSPLSLASACALSPALAGCQLQNDTHSMAGHPPAARHTGTMCSCWCDRPTCGDKACTCQQRAGTTPASQG